MTKKKSLLALAMALCLIIPATFMLTACGAKKSVVGSWETYQVVFPAEEEGGQETTVNVGDKFTFLGGETLSKDTYKLSIDDKNINLSLILGKSNTVTGAGTYTETDGVYSASIVVSNGEVEETFKTTTTYDKENDRLSCKIIYYEDDENTLYYTLILTRVNGK
ncbi:MAG: hypothetical protein ACI4T8_00925 [Christensenellales bacterium]